MIPADTHPEEDRRLTALRQLEVLDTEAENAYDEIVALAAEISGTPIALVSLVDEYRQWFKARHGLDASETPREVAFCSHAILNPKEPFVVTDATKDERFHDNPLVTGAPDIRFYASIPLILPETKLPLGTLCVISDKVQDIAESQLRALKVLGHQIERLLGLRRFSQQLLERNRLLEEATQAKSRFLATMSHDIRTPMNGIIGATELLRDEELPFSAKDHLGTITACSASLLHLINNILDLSKIEAGGLELRRQTIDLVGLVSETQKVIAGRASQKGLELRQDLAPELPTFIIGDQGRLHQIIINLLGNSVKFTAQGCVTLGLRSTEDSLIITVSDTGVGISEKDIDRIGQPFIQVGDTEQRKMGTGLGLSIVQSLVQAMDGTLNISSELGKGSAFSVHLPLEIAESHEQQAATQETKAVCRISSLQGKNILLVDDDAINRAVTSAILGKLGVKVTVASSGEEALSHQDKAFDAVLMDCQMPGLDGYETTRRWRSNEGSGPRTTILALTADAFDDNRQRCRSCGMDDLMTKPVTRASLREGLLNALS